jgi:Antibiotic biosynthesis monooxygenase
LEKPHHEPTPEQVLRQFRDHGSDQSAPYCAPLVDRAPGFISTTPHRSIDGTKVTMYGQWLSAEDYQAMRQDPGLLPFLQEALTIAKFELSIYEIVRRFWPAGENSQSSCRI